MSQLIKLRAFELSAGPGSAKVVSVSPDSLLDVEKDRILDSLNVKASDVTFHTTVNKKVDTTPLALDKTISAVGLKDNDILIVRVKRPTNGKERSQRETAVVVETPEPKGNTSGEESKVKSSDKKAVKSFITPSTSAEVVPTTDEYHKIIEGLTKELNASKEQQEKLAKELEKEKNNSKSRIQKLEFAVSALSNQTTGSSSGEDQASSTSRIQSKIEQYRRLTSTLLAEWMNTHRVFAVAQNTSPAPFVHYMDIHEKILERFFEEVGQNTISAADLIKHSPSLEAVYDALAYRYELKETENYNLVKRFLELFIPSFVCACAVICFICREREAEFLEEMHLSLKCSSITPSTWLRIKKLDGTFSYFSTVSGFSQRHRPLALENATCTTLELPDKIECKRLSLCNAVQEQCKVDAMYALRAELFGYSLCGSHHTDEVLRRMEKQINLFEEFLTVSLFGDL